MHLSENWCSSSLLYRAAFFLFHSTITTVKKHRTEIERKKKQYRIQAPLYSDLNLSYNCKPKKCNSDTQNIAWPCRTVTYRYFCLIHPMTEFIVYYGKHTHVMHKYWPIDAIKRNCKKQLITKNKHSNITLLMKGDLVVILLILLYIATIFFLR